MTHFAGGDTEARDQEAARVSTGVWSPHSGWVTAGALNEGQFPEVWGAVGKEPRRGPEQGQRRAGGPAPPPARGGRSQTPGMTAV